MGRSARYVIGTSAGKSAGAADTNVRGSDPYGFDAKPRRNRHGKAHGSGRVPVATGRRMDSKPDVSRMTLDVGSGTDSEVDAAGFFQGVGMKHTEVVRGHIVDRVRSKVCQL